MISVWWPFALGGVTGVAAVSYGIASHFPVTRGWLAPGWAILAVLLLGVMVVLLYHERKRRHGAHAALTRTRDHFQLLVEGIKDYAIFMLDTEGRVVSWNAGAEAIKGYKQSEILGKHFSCFYTNEDIASGKPERALRVAAEQGRFRDDAWRVRKDGSRFWASVVITALHDAEGQLRGFAKVTYDGTLKKKADEELQRSKQLLNNFFAASPVGLAIVDAQFFCLKVNSTLCAMTGQTVDECLGKPVDDVLGDLALQVKPCLQSVIDTGRPLLNRELSGGGPDEPVGYWMTSYFPVINQNGQVQQIGAVMLDITERRRAEEAVQENEEMLGNLSRQLIRTQDEERRRIARELHDSIGQCLTALKMQLETLAGAMGAPASDSKPHEVLHASLVLADQCLSDTRTISYLLHPPLLDQVGLPAALRWYVDGFVTRSGIEVQLDIPPDFPRHPRDVETALFRVVQESLTNIHRHSGSPTATIRLETDAECVRLEVADQGCGIPPQKLRRCNGNKGVLGVGMAGMRERVKQLGGRLDVSSSSQGTTVTAVLPVEGDV